MLTYCKFKPAETGGLFHNLSRIACDFITRRAGQVLDALFCIITVLLIPVSHALLAFLALAKLCFGSSNFCLNLKSIASFLSFRFGLDSKTPCLSYLSQLKGT